MAYDFIWSNSTGQRLVPRRPQDAEHDKVHSGLHSKPGPLAVISGVSMILLTAISRVHKPVVPALVKL